MNPPGKNTLFRMQDQIGLAELDAAIALVRLPEGETRGLVLAGAAQRLDQLTAAVA
jgi:hypothetical protein